MRISADGTRKLDTIEASEVLLDADALAAALGCTVEVKDARRAARIDLPSGGRKFTFPGPRKDLRPFDQLVLTLCTDDITIRPRLHVDLTTRTKGLVHNDSFNTGRGAVVSLPTWGEYPFPWENFLVFGLGELVYPVAQMTLEFGEPSRPGSIWAAELRAERRGRPEGPRLTDEGLLAELQLDAAGPEQVLAHFRARGKPIDIYSDLPAAPDGWTPATADRICEHFINGYFVGDPIDWRINPNGYLEWMHALNRHGWFRELLTAYRASGEARYVRKLDEIWLSWIRANPEPVGHNGGGDPAWETLSTAVRIYGTWLNAFFALLHDENLRDSTRLEVLKSFSGHAEHLMHHQGHANNWLVVESRVLYVLGLLFPEFRRAGDWLAEGARRLDHEITRQIYPDGADWELAPGYHMMASQGFLEGYELARLNALTSPPAFAERLPRTFDYVAGMTRPDGTLPSVNDSSGYRSRSGRAFLKYGARLFDRDELLESPEGPCAGRSRAFPDAGFHILASGRGHEAMWLLFDCGGPGASHRHDDALNLEVFAFGLPFIVDPGITGYFKDDWTRYYRRTESHNTVLVDGAGQIASTNLRTAEAASARGLAQCAFGEAADFVRCTYAYGYEDLPDDVTHTRAVLFVRGAYWAIFDEVAGQAAGQMEARFQFVPLRLTIDRRGRRFRTLRQNKPNLELIVAAPARGAKLSVAAGQTDPVGGWVSDGEDVPAPQARIRLARPGDGQNLRLVTVIYPFATGVNSGVAVRPRRDEPDGIVGIDVRVGRRRDTIRYGWDGRLLELRTPDQTVRLEGDRWVAASS